MEIFVNTDEVKKMKGNISIELSDELLDSFSEDEELLSLIGEFAIKTE